MPQELTSIQTNNAAGVADGGGFFGSLFNGLSKLVTTAAPVAANIYTLQMQGDALKSQLLSQQLAANQPKVSTSAPAMSWYKPWMLWAGVGGVVAVLFFLLRRKR